MGTISKILALVALQAMFVTTTSANTLMIKETTSTAASTLSEEAVEEQKDTLGRTVLLQDFSIKKVIETDDAGNQILNDDGSVKYHYYVVDKDGTVWNASTVQTIYDIRSKAYKKILLKIALGGGLGALDNGKIESILIGIAGGAISSIDDVQTIFKLNKSLKKFRKQLAAYKTTFTDEGLPIDPSVDLANVNGIDFTKSEELTKSASDVKAELSSSLEAAPALENLEI